ncbi:hypothetical protein [Kitasatospora sp. NPDC057223]|uniref:hypothetical protein n=1 Tax=Kitasatospora sp. NPDC057223 TaxID=3346055 RepID=UPI003639E4A7
MHVHFIAPERYLRASHEIIRHGRLKATAKTLLLWGLSLPEGSRDTLLTIGARMPEGRTAVSGARTQLLGEGYLHVQRTQHPTKGTWTTRTLLTSVPLTDPQEIAAAWAEAEAAREASREAARAAEGRNPALGGAATRMLGTSPSGEKKGGNTSHPAATAAARAKAVRKARPPVAKAPVAAPLAAPPAAPLDPDAAATAAKLLCGLTAQDTRLRIGLPEALALAPLVTRWLAHDRSTDRLRDALLTGLPDRIHAPEAFLRTRLERKMPAPAAPAAPPRTLHECTHCAGPVPRPGTRCARCTGAAHPATGPDAATAERNRRGVARARRIIRGEAPLPV